MRIKTYLVPTLSEAVAQIKKDLGPKAVILSTKKAPYKGKFWWKNGLTQLEVTAAVDVESQGLSSPSPSSSVGQAMNIFNKVAEDKVQGLKQEIDLLRESLGSKIQVQNVPEQEVKEEKSSAPVVSLSESVQISSQNFSKLQDKGRGIIRICRVLLNQHVSPQKVQALADELLNASAAPSNLEEYAAQWLMDQLPQPTPYISDHDPKVMVLVGPTGSGKTTTLAKLASILSLKKRKTLGFITVDHFRIGAEEQMRKYAAILAAPCELVTDASEFRQALERMKSQDVILVDTIGRSPHDDEGIDALKKILGDTTGFWKAFVAPATLRDQDLIRAMDAFTTLDFNNIIITKLDETSEYGSLFNASASSQIPLSYFTMGQEVPEDIEDATKERVIDCLFDFSGQASQQDGASLKAPEKEWAEGARQ